MAETDSTDRPSPDALLEVARKEHRGRLKIFLGSAPGVGKTYAMLAAAQEAVRDGVDVVIGVVETHGRSETEALLPNLEIVPLRTVEYRGRTFREMDLDAILDRHPRLVLVDELAHTNIPGSRHVKRYQDVEELLDTGIDVWSTLNIQHLESLNDVVERIAGIQVRETLPDGVLQDADEIELIDLPPQELLKRLQEGKVYVPEQARRAIDHFFSPGNLTALREMALRHAAERVDAQMLTYMRAHAIPGPWPARERIMVCIGPESAALRLVRATKRAAERRQVPWVAVYVETHRHHNLSEEAKDCISRALRLAVKLGGETSVLHGDDITAEILAFARSRNVSQIVVGRSGRRRGLGFFRRTLTDDLQAHNSTIDVLMVAGEDEPPTAALRTETRRRPVGWRAYGAATLAVAVATGLGLVIDRLLPLPNVSLVYLMAVLLTATRFGLAPSIYASVLSFLAYNFAFTEPRLTFAVSDTHNVLTVVFFLITAVIVSNLAARLRSQVETTTLSARRTENLYEFSRKVAVAASRDDVLWAVVHHVASTIRGRSLVLMPKEGRLAIEAGYPPEDRLDDKSMAAAEWAWSNDAPAGRGSATLPTSEWLFLPLKTGRGSVGVLGVQIDGGTTLLSPEQNRLLGTLAGQAAVAIERTTLVSDVEAARVATETERLRSALLSSLSHDLRTPLASIMGASTSLLSYGDTLDRDDRHELARTIQDEAERLNRFVQNLLDMTRLGSGALKPRADWVDLREIVSSALDRAARLLGDRRIRLDVDPEMPMLCVDFVLIEQVFFNLIDNACKYAPKESPITIWARRRDNQALIEVCDQGPGIPPEDRDRVFDMFYRVAAGDSQVAGTGLGLAICRGLVEIHKGTITVMPGMHGIGTCIVIRLPIEAEPALPESAAAGS